jgi:hypothetical protein
MDPVPTQPAVDFDRCVAVKGRPDIETQIRSPKFPMGGHTARVTYPQRR